MQNVIDYAIVAQEFHGENPTHSDLEDKVKELLAKGYERLGGPVIGPEMMYQAMVCHSRSDSK